LSHGLVTGSTMGAWSAQAEHFQLAGVQCLVNG